jgi:hypothetical protein
MVVKCKIMDCIKGYMWIMDVKEEFGMGFNLGTFDDI